VISLWLTPSEDDRAYLQNIINDLASEYQAPVFPPHLTLYSPTNLSKDALKDIIEPITENTQAIFVTMHRLSQTTNIWKTIFIELEGAPDLTQLQQNIISSLSDPNPYFFEPHISLIYKEMPVEQKEEIIRNLTVRNSFKMDKITAVRTGPNVAEWEQVIEVSLA